MKVKIKNYEFLIIEVNAFEVTENVEFAYGQTDHVHQIIRINQELQPEQKRQTLIHELTHAFMQVYGFGQITEQVPVEIMCDFMGCYADDIIKIADSYEKR